MLTIVQFTSKFCCVAAQEWNTELAAFAEDYVLNACTWGHSSQSSRTGVGGFTFVGENLYVTSLGGSGVDVVAQINTAIQLWYDEIVDYNLATRTCAPGRVCGHYTQVRRPTDNQGVPLVIVAQSRYE